MQGGQGFNLLLQQNLNVSTAAPCTMNLNVSTIEVTQTRVKITQLVTSWFI